MSKLGEFEMLVLMALLRHSDQPYANNVRDDLQTHAGRSVTRGALYRTFDRLTEKGFLSWELEPSAIPERGGHPMRRLAVTPEGLEAVRAQRDVLMSYMADIGHALD